MSLLIDDFNFKDAVPLSIDSVTFDATPMYYDDVYVQICSEENIVLLER